MLSIKIKVDNIWKDANNLQKDAFIQYKNENGIFRGESNYDFVENNENYTIQRIGDIFHGGIYITKNNEIVCPIADWNDVKVFLLDQPTVNWYNARIYQTLCYYDFIYSNDVERKYKSRNTVGYNDHIEIPLENIDSNIVFSISRNDNETIFYQRNDINRTPIRMSDNESARREYLAFYRRITDNTMDIIIEAMSSSTILKLPNNIIITKTVNEEIMCIICNDNTHNIKFLNCNHTNVCSECYKKLIKPLECPMCKNKIDKIISYTP